MSQSVLDSAKHILRGLKRLGDDARTLSEDGRLADALAGALAQMQPLFPATQCLGRFGDRFIRYEYRPFFGWGGNLGDWIQSEATEQAIRAVAGETARFVPWQRSELSWYAGEPAVCVMQGWFDNATLGFLPNPRVLPVWVGTHFTNQTRTRLEWMLRLRQTAFSGQELGCRDLSTVRWCRRHHINAYFSRCLTLTFPKRAAAPERGRVFCVNCPDWLMRALPGSLREEAIRLDQRGAMLGYAPADEAAYAEAARAQLRRFRDEARLVVTTALHCAQPCLAMGIPVVFVDPAYREADRFSSMRGIIPIWTRTDAESGRIDFDPACPDIEPLKADLLENLRLSLARARGEQVDPAELAGLRRRIRAFDVTRGPSGATLAAPPASMRGKQIQIFVVYHKPAPVLDQPPFVPLQVGDGPAINGFLRDDTGDNIAPKNPNFCELTAQYWIWKNAKADYVGLCHYRRLLGFMKSRTTTFSEPTAAEYARFGWSEACVQALLANHDILLPPAWEMFPVGEPGNFVSAYDFFSRQYGTKAMDALLDVIRMETPRLAPYAGPVLRTPRKMVFGNICVMRKDLYDAYSEWLFTVLFALERRIELPKKKEDARLFGYFGEYLLNLWVEYAKDNLGARVWHAPRLVKMTHDRAEERLLETAVLAKPRLRSERPRLSVVIPAYNVGRYIRRCLNSVCGQAEEEIEILCVNDGSTDDTQTLLEAFARRDGRIRIVNQRNRGLGAARNRGLSMTRGDWLAFVDSDDWVDKVIWHRTIAKAERLDLDMLLFEPMDVDEETGRQSQTVWSRLRLPTDCYRDAFTWRDIDRSPFDTCCYAPVRLIRRTFFGNRRFPEGVLYEDAAIHIDLLLSAKRLGAFACPLYYYRRRKTSLMGLRDRRVLDHLRIAEAVAQDLEAKGLWGELQPCFLDYAMGLLRKTYAMWPTEEAFRALCDWMLRPPQRQWAWAKAGRQTAYASQLLRSGKRGRFATFCERRAIPRHETFLAAAERIHGLTPCRGALKQALPYGLMCLWLRERYGIVEDKPLLAYPGALKRAKRVVKFALPYGLVEAWKHADVATQVNGGSGIVSVFRRILRPRGK